MTKASQVYLCSDYVYVQANSFILKVYSLRDKTHVHRWNKRNETTIDPGQQQERTSPRKTYISNLTRRKTAKKIN